MHLIDADKNPCKGCPSKPYCNHMCISRTNWEKEYVDLDIKQGHWVKEEDYFGSHFNCSLCKDCKVRCNEEDLKGAWNYCPHCGAKMYEVIK